MRFLRFIVLFLGLTALFMLSASAKELNAESLEVMASPASLRTTMPTEKLSAESLKETSSSASLRKAVPKGETPAFFAVKATASLSSLGKTTPAEESSPVPLQKGFSLTSLQEGASSVSRTAKESGEVSYTYKIISQSGEETFYSGTSFAELKESAEGMKNGDTLMLLADFTATETSLKNSITVKDNTAIDLNGHTVTFEKSTAIAYFKVNKSTFYLYSSKAGGALCLGPEADGVFFYSGGTLYVGKDLEGVVYDKENLLLSGTSVAKVAGANAVMIHSATVKASGTKALFIGGASNVSLTVKNALLSLASFTGNVFYSEKSSFSVTLEKTHLISYAEQTPLSLTAVKSDGIKGTLTLSEGCVLSYSSLSVADSFPVTVGKNVLLSKAWTDGALSEDLVSATVSPRYPTDPITGGAVLFPLCYQVSEKKDTHTATFVSGEESFSECWRREEIPSHAFETAFGTYYYEVRGTAPITEDTVYRERMLRSSVSKVSGCLSLTESITFCLYIPNDGYIISAEAGGITKDFTKASPESNGSFLFLLPMDPKNLTDAFTLTLRLTGGESYTVALSLQKYIQAVLRAYPKDTASVRLVKTLAAYVREVSCYFFENGQLTCEPSVPGLAAIEKILGADYEIPKHEISSEGTLPPVGGKAILSAALNLVSDPGYAFRLHEDFSGTVTVSFLGRSAEYRVKNGLWNGSALLLVENIGISSFRSELMVVCRGEETDALDFTFTYDLDAYMRGFTDGIPPYAYALYDYVIAAEEYVRAKA